MILFLFTVLIQMAHPSAIGGVVTIANESESSLKIAENQNEGKVLVLSDKSKWEVSPEDVSISSLWIFPSNVQIAPNVESADYPFLIKNLRSGSVVQARKIEEQNSE